MKNGNNRNNNGHKRNGHKKPGETIFVVDPDKSSQDKIGELARGMNLNHQPFSFGRDFLTAYDKSMSGCVILEVRISDVSGLQLQQQLAEEESPLPVIFLSSHATVPVVVRAVQQGAVHFMEKPADEQELWESIQRALQVDRERRAALAEAEDFQTKLESLTQKEHDVLRLLAEDKSTRAIANELKVSVRTVEFRRANMLRKLAFKTPMQLFHFAIRAYDGHEMMSRELVG